MLKSIIDWIVDYIVTISMAREDLLGVFNSISSRVLMAESICETHLNATLILVLIWNHIDEFEAWSSAAKTV